MNLSNVVIQKKKVKNITIKVKLDGKAYIDAPLNIDDDSIIKFLNNKEKWINSKLELVNKYNKINENRDKYIDKTYIFYLGYLYMLSVKKSDKTSLIIKDNIIIIESEDISPKYIKDLVYNKLYYVNAKKIFKDRLDFYISITGQVNDITLKISHIKSKWGTCIPSKREINLSIELMKKSILEIDSVVIHEVAHLTHPNHSKNFYNYISNYFKDYKEITKKLNSFI